MRIQTKLMLKVQGYKIALAVINLIAGRGLAILYQKAETKLGRAQKQYLESLPGSDPLSSQLGDTQPNLLDSAPYSDEEQGNNTPSNSSEHHSVKL